MQRVGGPKEGGPRGEEWGAEGHRGASRAGQEGAWREPGGGAGLEGYIGGIKGEEQGRGNRGTRGGRSKKGGRVTGCIWRLNSSKVGNRGGGVAEHYGVGCIISARGGG